MLLLIVYDTLDRQTIWGIKMLVSSFGYLNKGSNSISGVRIDNKNQVKPAVNQGFVSKVYAQGEHTVNKPVSADCTDKKHLNVLA